MYACFAACGVAAVLYHELSAVLLDPLPGELLGESVTNQYKHTGITGIARQQGKALQPTTHARARLSPAQGRASLAVTSLPPHGRHETLQAGVHRLRFVRQSREMYIVFMTRVLVWRSIIMLVDARDMLAVVGSGVAKGVAVSTRPVAFYSSKKGG